MKRNLLFVLCSLTSMQVSNLQASWGSFTHGISSAARTVGGGISQAAKATAAAAKKAAEKTKILAEITTLSTELAGLETAKQTATGALKLAQTPLVAARNSLNALKQAVKAASWLEKQVADKLGGSLGLGTTATIKGSSSGEASLSLGFNFAGKSESLTASIDVNNPKDIAQNIAEAIYHKIKP